MSLLLLLRNSSTAQVDASASGAFADVTAFAATGAATGTKSATGTGALSSVTVAAATGSASGTTSANGNASGALQSISATSATGSGIGYASASSGLQSVSVSPATAQAQGSAQATGSASSVNVTSATGTASGSASQDAAATAFMASITVVALNGSASGDEPINNADTHDGYFHKLWRSVAEREKRKPETIEELESQLDVVEQEIEQVQAIAVPIKATRLQSIPTPQFNQHEALLEKLLHERQQLVADIEEEESIMLLM